MYRVVWSVGVNDTQDESFYQWSTIQEAAAWMVEKIQSMAAPDLARLNWIQTERANG